MLANDYREMVKDLCEATNTPDWEKIADDGHVVVDETLIRLAHDEQLAPDVLGLYIDLGDQADLPALATGMLRHNVEATPNGGCFGVLPDGQRVIYRVDRPWVEAMGGAELATELAARVADANAALVRCALE